MTDIFLNQKKKALGHKVMLCVLENREIMQNKSFIRAALLVTDPHLTHQIPEDLRP